MTDHDSFMTATWDYRMVMEAYDMIATYNSLERETTAHGSARSINIFRVSPRLAGKRKTFKVGPAFISNLPRLEMTCVGEFTAKSSSPKTLTRSFGSDSEATYLYRYVEPQFSEVLTLQSRTFLAR